MLRHSARVGAQYAHGSNGILKTWFQKYRLPPGAIRIASAAELEEKYGDEVKQLQLEYQSEYKLGKALEQRTPPLYVGHKIVGTWLQKYGGQASVKNIDSAGHL